MPPFNLLAIKPKEIIKNVYKDFAEMMFIKIPLIKAHLDCLSSSPAPKGGGAMAWGAGGFRDSEEEN